MKEIIYIANIRFPTEKAHGIQIAKTCESLSKQGVDITLVVPWRSNHIKEKAYKFYGINNNFKIKRLFSVDLVFLGKIGFMIQTLSFSLSVLIFLGLNYFVRHKNSVAIYSRDEWIIFILSFFKGLIIWEAHQGNTNLPIRFILHKNLPFICITDNLKKLYQPYTSGRIAVIPDGVDIELFNTKKTKIAARQSLGLPIDAKIVLYTGHLYKWKGVDVLAESAKDLDDNTKVIFVGGTDEEVLRFRKKYQSIKNIMVLGYKPYEMIPLYLWASDVVILPNTAKEDVSMLYTSPLKLFEYMASGSAIIASDLPSLREVLNDSNCAFFRPDNPESLSSTIKNILSDDNKRLKIAQLAKRDVANYTWDNRAKKIIDFIFYV